MIELHILLDAEGVLLLEGGQIAMKWRNLSRAHLVALDPHFGDWAAFLQCITKIEGEPGKCTARAERKWFSRTFGEAVLKGSLDQRNGGISQERIWWH